MASACETRGDTGDVLSDQHDETSFCWTKDGTVMAEPLILINSADLATGESAEVVADGRIFAVYNVDGIFHVLDGICPHAGGPLGKGMLNGNIVTCPWHGWQFDVSSGQHCLNATLCQTRYDVELIEGNVCIRVE